jgi:hypothetical protein
VSEGQAAIAGVNGKALKDQTLVVNAARPPSGNRGGGPYGDRRSGAYGDRRGGGSSGDKRGSGFSRAWPRRF